MGYQISEVYINIINFFTQPHTDENGLSIRENANVPFRTNFANLTSIYKSLAFYRDESILNNTDSQFLFESDFDVIDGEDDQEEDAQDDEEESEEEEEDTKNKKPNDVEDQFDNEIEHVVRYFVKKVTDDKFPLGRSDYKPAAVITLEEIVEEEDEEDENEDQGREENYCEGGNEIEQVTTN